MEQPQDLKGWASLLARNWQARAQLPTRDLFVASHPGWNDPVAWERHARTELELFLSGLEPGFVQQADVLEIGCGSGRLAQFLRPMVTSYSGFDIAPAMVQGAEQRCRGMDGVRFAVGDGLSVPDGLRDRAYQLILACAVFIHCPREVIAANIEHAFGCLAPGGQLRLQVLADPNDREGLAVPDSAAVAATEVLQQDAHGTQLQLGEEEMRLATQTYYMGQQFRYAEFQEFLQRLTGGRISLYRGDLGAIYASCERAR